MHFKINRKTIIIFFICFVFLCSIFITGRVDAASGHVYGGYINQAGDASCVGCPSGGYSGSYQSIASGYRITIINKDGTQIGNTHDFWADWKMTTDSSSFCFNNHRGYSFLVDDSACKGNVSPHETKYKYTKNKVSKIYGNDKKGGIADNEAKYNMSNSGKEFFLTKTYYSWLKTSSKFSSLYSIRNELIGQTAGWGSSYKYPDYQYSNNFTKFAIETFIHAIEDLSNDDTSKSNKAKEAFSKLLSECGITINNNNFSQLNGKYMLIETLLAVWDINGEHKILVGSLHDLKYLGYHPYDYNADPSLYTGLSNVNPIIYNTITIKDNSNNVVLNGCDATKSAAGNSDNPVSGTNKSNLFNANGCAGIFTIDLSDLAINSNKCPSVASSYWKSINKGEIKIPGQSKATLFKNTIIGKLKNDGAYSDDYAWLANFDKYGYTWDSLGDLLSTTCDFNCNAAVRNIFNTSSREKKDIKNMIKTNSKYSELRKKMTGGNTYYYELYGEGINVDDKNLCAPVTCNEALLGTMSTFVPSIGKRVNNSVELTASQFTSEGQRSVLQGLYNIFNDKDFLNPDNVFSFRYIACKEIDSCYPEMEVDARCVSNGKTFTLYDSNKIDKCIKSGIAYNNKRANGTIAGSGNINESSVDTIDGNGKCREKVSFTFPGDETGIKAGTVFTWGTGRSITGQPKTEIFGTMTVERTCYLNGKSSISMKWADNNINPKIALYYKEAIPNSVTSYTSKKINGTNLNVENIIKEINVYSDESGTQRIGGNNSGKVVKCGGNCNNAKRVDMKASYDIKYGPSFLWSYNRNLNDTGLTLEKSDSENNYYTAIGYGLPTSFVTPTGMKGNYEFGSTVTSNDSNGYMYVKVNNVGTCKNSASNECHFNKSLTFAVTDDNAADKTSIYYKCKFDIENELFGTEDGDDANPNDPPKGLDVVFRTVQLINKNVSDSEKEAELNKAFPGRSGNGRYTSRDRNNNRVIGSNWLTIENNEADNTKRIFEILSNMVYAQEPAYHIVLDTTKINYIRRNNVTYRNADFDPYTSNQRYKFDKTGANIYAYGASDFITELINTNWLDGVCASGDTDARAKRGACRQS